jgi:hypothetical protein
MEVKKLLECYFTARSTQSSFFSRCLSTEVLSEEEKEVIFEIVENIYKKFKQNIKILQS